MQNVVLIVHLLLSLGLIGAVLLQRNEGGGLGMGGGGPAGSRAPTTPMAKVTWVLAAAFIVTSITLTIFAAQNSAGTSILDRLGTAPAAPAQSDTPATPGSDLNIDGLLPPPTAGDAAPAPLTPKADN